MQELGRHKDRVSRNRRAMEDAVTLFANTMHDQFGQRAVDVARAQWRAAEGVAEQSWSAVLQVLERDIQDRGIAVGDPAAARSSSSVE